MYRNTLVFTAAVFSLSAVVLAALGAHLLQPEQIAMKKIWATAQQFHFFHAAALLAIAALAELRKARLVYWSGLLIALGVLFFSGTLYLRASGLDWLPGSLTPTGGLVIMAGWVLLIVALMKKSDF